MSILNAYGDLKTFLTLMNKYGYGAADSYLKNKALLERQINAEYLADKKDEIIKTLNNYIKEKSEFLNYDLKNRFYNLVERFANSSSSSYIMYLDEIIEYIKELDYYANNVYLFKQLYRIIDVSKELDDETKTKFALLYENICNSTTHINSKVAVSNFFKYCEEADVVIKNELEVKKSIKEYEVDAFGEEE